MRMHAQVTLTSITNCYQIVDLAVIIIDRPVRCYLKFQNPIAAFTYTSTIVCVIGYVPQGVGGTC